MLFPHIFLPSVSCFMQIIYKFRPKAGKRHRPLSRLTHRSRPARVRDIILCIRNTMKYLRPEFPIAIALTVLLLGVSLEHAAVEHGGAMLWGLLLVILAAIIGVAFRIAHHAEVLAMRLGEPYGTLILTLAAVSVEVVILVVLLQGAPNPTLARDTGVAAVMLDIDGIRGLAAIIGGLKHGQTKYNISSANSFIAMLLVAIGVGMFIPDFVPQHQWGSEEHTS